MRVHLQKGLPILGLELAQSLTHSVNQLRVSWSPLPNHAAAVAVTRKVGGLIDSETGEPNSRSV